MGADLVQDALHEIEDADRLVEALEQAVVDGDESVQPEQIEHARALGRFARLRQRAAERKAAEQAAQAEADAFEKLLAEYLPGTEPVDAKVDALIAKAVPFLREAAGLIRERNRRVQAMAQHVPEPPYDARVQYNDPSRGWRHDAADRPELVGSAVPAWAAWFDLRGTEEGVQPVGVIVERLVERLYDVLGSTPHDIELVQAVRRA